MKSSDLVTGTAAAVGVGCVLFALNRSLGADAAFGDDVRRSAVGALIAGVAVSGYLPLRRRIRNMIGKPKQ
ncbi:MAG: hypothetical protein GC152_05210 [Alphaproteobacteria bacterium]|nr:hypothetical protein [Alphaproteobacteria bacterium]